MPIYEYKCEVKGCTETVERLSKEPLIDVRCPKCNQTMRRLFSVPAFKFTNGAGTHLGNLMNCPSNPPKSY